MKRYTLSLCMIIKNEEKFIEKCLDAVSAIVDEFIIVDTGSKDSTLDIVSKYNVNLYNYTWINDFSAARNFALNKATSDWILFLDADEILDDNSKDKILNFINNTKYDGCHFIVHNYNSENKNDYTIHYALRLFKNNKGYYYKGKIHEQISNNEESNLLNKFSNENILLHHYGYSNEVLKEKDKRARNIPILLECLKNEPNDSFTLFNLANEYLAKNEIYTALEYYNLSYKNINIKQHYAIHLYYRISVCYHNIKDYSSAIKYINEALQHFCPNVDFEYLKGCIYYDWGKYTLAIDSFNKCLEIGDEANTIKFINNCGSINPLISLGNLYFKLSDYSKALDSYNKALNLNNNNLNLLYKIGTVLNKLFINKNEVKDNLLIYFSSKEYTPNIILTLDILIRENLFYEAELLINEHQNFKGYFVDYNYIAGIINFHNKKYTYALRYFNNV
ncbi:glycosyltransferase, partial [Clostridium sp. AL.422]|uniref:glycosyltransferase n=1 Tax=Clostridium TaxID=1485 RepID=UPI00293DD956